MNVLYFTYYQVDPHKGGTERTTTSVARYLRGASCRVYSAYVRDAATTADRDVFDDTCRVAHRDSRGMAEAISRFNIDVVINQGDFFMNEHIRRAIDESGRAVKLVFAHHFEPAFELTDVKASTLRRRLSLSKAGVVNALRLALMPVYGPYYKRRLRRLYAAVMRQSDCVVLLSNYFIEEFRQFAGSGDGEFKVIHNPLSFADFAGDAVLASKKKTVLTVSRLYEAPKKLSLLIRAWRRIADRPEARDWQLVIVGDGPDRKMYEQMARGADRITFAGRQQPLPYYRDAAIFGMTSESEGWGLTLTEAQQMGCVPVAMDSYAALHDIVTDGYNGIIVPYHDIDAFAEALIKLMGSPELRTRLAVNAVESARRFLPDTIGGQWLELLNNLCRPEQ